MWFKQESNEFQIPFRNYSESVVVGYIKNLKSVGLGDGIIRNTPIYSK